MDSKFSAKLVSLFLVLSVCLLGYTAMNTWAHPFPIPGAINIDSDTSIYQSTTPGSIVQVRFSDSVETLNKLTVDHEYIQINDGIKIGVQSIVNCELNLTTWEPIPKNTPGMVASFALSSAGNWVPFTFYIGNLNVGSWYNVLIDGVLGPSHITASNDGIIGFTFAGNPGEHDFEIQQLSFAPATIHLLSIILPLIAMGILLSILGEVVFVAKEKRKFKTKDFIDMAIFIVISTMLLTLVGYIIASLP